ncbi:hypothetical protein BDQ17DRAFT_1358049 [Cyathus striatus]|nr:hypothetical protein BDQ17DRAFT_1358049 [Cyathus striatus]
MTSEKGAGSLFSTTMHPTPMVVDRLFSSNMDVEYAHPLFSDIDLALPAPVSQLNTLNFEVVPLSSPSPYLPFFTMYIHWHGVRPTLITRDSHGILINTTKRKSAVTDDTRDWLPHVEFWCWRFDWQILRRARISTIVCHAMSGGPKARIHTLWIPSFSPALGNAIPTYVSALLSMKVGAFSPYRIT